MKILNRAVLATIICITFYGMLGCQNSKEENNTASSPVKLVTLDPGHFHAALVQKSSYNNVSDSVHVYAPAGPDVKLHLTRIENFNNRSESPTFWQEITYTGDDFFEKMLAEKQGNVVVLAGNNQKKTEYIYESIKNGFNVLADKPMVINVGDFELLKQAFQLAEEKNLLLYDIMTERFEISTILQKELSQIESVFGTLVEGTPEDPAITKESVHHFFKYVSGNILTRPPWFMDVAQEGEGIVDVTTHLVDLIQWEAFPGQIIDYQTEIALNHASRWTTAMTPKQFKDITQLDEYPDYLRKYVVDDSILNVYCNGEINYKIKGVHAKVSVIWAYQAPPGGGDTHFSIMRGSRANLVIRQGPTQNFVPTLYIEPNEITADFEDKLNAAVSTLQSSYPGLGLIKVASGWQLSIPDRYRVGHEAHFTQVTENFLEFLTEGKMPSWEVPNMLAKYYVTTQALEMASAQ